MQIILDWMIQDKVTDEYNIERAVYWKAIKDLAKMIWEDPDKFWYCDIE